jgi:hypothetical protein
MKTLLMLAALCFMLPAGIAGEPAVRPVVTEADFRELLLHTKWTWRNVQAGVPDRECIFMADGTFRHPNFVAKFAIKDLHVVQLNRKDGKAVLTFDKNYTSFEAVDFNNKRITGKRL